MKKSTDKLDTSKLTSFKSVIVPGSPLQCEPIHFSLYRDAYSLWRNVMGDALRNDSKAEEPPLVSDDFLNQHEISCLQLDDKVVALFMYYWIDFEFESCKDLTYFNVAIPNEAGEKIKSFNDKQIMIMSNLVIDKPFRKTNYGKGVSDLLLALALIRFYCSNATRLIIYTRNDRKVNQLCYDFRGTPVLRDFISHGIPSDAIMFTKSVNHFKNKNALFKLAMKLYIEKLNTLRLNLINEDRRYLHEVICKNDPNNSLSNLIAGSSTMKNKVYDYIIIGAGPAGVQLSYFFQQNNIDYLVIEGSDHPGSFFDENPRHGKLISINKVNTGYEDPELQMRWDWNSLLCDDEKFRFSNYSSEYFPQKEDFTRYISDFTKHFNLNIQYNSKVSMIKKDKHFYITLENNSILQCKRLIVASGTSEVYLPHEIPGIEYCDNYFNMSIDPKDFANKRLLIIGKGNSAFETADHLIGATCSTHICSPNSLKLAWQTHYVGHLRAVNNNFLDTYQLKSQNAVLDADIMQIKPVNDKYEVTFKYHHAEDEVEVLKYDKIIACTGFKFDDSIFSPCTRPMLTINNRFPAQTACWESINIMDLYFAGSLMQVCDFKQFMSAFIHGFRYNIKSLYHILMHRYQGIPLPATKLEPDSLKLSNKLMERINQASSLWQQPGFLCDVVVCNGEMKYYYDINKKFAREYLSNENNVFILTLEYGKHSDVPNVFGAARIKRTNTNNSDLSAFIHPVIRHYKNNELIAEHHVIEDLAAEWKEPEHFIPLQKFLAQQLDKLPLDEPQKMAANS